MLALGLGHTVKGGDDCGYITEVGVRLGNLAFQVSKQEEIK